MNDGNVFLFALYVELTTLPLVEALETFFIKKLQKGDCVYVAVVSHFLTVLTLGLFGFKAFSFKRL